MKKIIHTPYAPAAIGTYNQAVQSKGFIYTAGQVGIVPGTGKIIEGGINKPNVPEPARVPSGA